MAFPQFFPILVALALFAPGAAPGQGTEKCPAVWVDGPTSAVTSNQPLVLTARLTGSDPAAKVEFRWEVSAGTIVSGQGTPSITIDIVGLEGMTVTAKVFVAGLSKACPGEASRSVNTLLQTRACGLPLDQYGDIQFEDEKARLDNFAIELFNQKTSTGYIFVYAGRRSYEAEAAERLLRAKDYLVRVRKMDPARVIIVDGGYMEDFHVDLIIAPQGATPPYSMPTFSPTEIELTKPRPRDPVKRKIRKRK